MPWPRNRTTSLLAAGPACLLTCLLTCALLAGCSGDDSTDQPAGPTTSDHASDATDATSTRVVIGQVRGKLKPPARRQLRAQVREIVDRYLESAYGGTYPRGGFAAAFDDFTPSARSRANKRAAVLTNYRHDGITAVTFGARSVRVDVLAPKGRAVGATARLRVVLKVTAGQARTEVVKGRLLLTPGPQRWRVFGFDITRGER